LRLLKDLQQQSRAYVAKTGVKVTPLNPAKRLTGELGPIQAPAQEVLAGGRLSEEELLRMALAVLESRRIGPGDRVGPFRPGDRLVLQETGHQLGAAAVARPAEYLGAYEAFKKLLAGEAGVDVVVVEQAIRRLLPIAEATAAVQKGTADGGLGNLYFGDIGK